MFGFLVCQQKKNKVKNNDFQEYYFANWLNEHLLPLMEIQTALFSNNQRISGDLSTINTVFNRSFKVIPVFAGIK